MIPPPMTTTRARDGKSDPDVMAPDAIAWGAITDVRLDHAQESLGEGSLRHLSSTEIRATVGFGDSSAFVRSLEPKHGMTPQAWCQDYFTSQVIPPRYAA